MALSAGRLRRSIECLKTIIPGIYLVAGKIHQATKHPNLTSTKTKA